MPDIRSLHAYRRRPRHGLRRSVDTTQAELIWASLRSANPFSNIFHSTSLVFKRSFGAEPDKQGCRHLCRADLVSTADVADKLADSTPDPRLGAWLDRRDEAASGEGGKGRACSFRVWAPHPSQATVEIRRKRHASIEVKSGDGAAWDEVVGYEMTREGNEWTCRVNGIAEVRPKGVAQCAPRRHVTLFPAQSRTLVEPSHWDKMLL